MGLFSSHRELFKNLQAAGFHLPTNVSVRKWIVWVVSIFVTLPVSSGPLASIPKDTGLSSHQRITTSQSFGQQAISFEANVGQWPQATRFAARSNGHTILLSKQGIQLTAEEITSVKSRTQEDIFTSYRATFHQRGVELSRREISSLKQPRHKLTMKLVNANEKASLSGEVPLSEQTHYLVGNKPSQWQTGVPHYGEVKARGVYPGIDLVYHSRRGQLEYDFIVAPGASPGKIRMAYEGAQELKLTPTGELTASTNVGAVQQPTPIIYQDINGVRRQVEGRYVLQGNEVGFEIGAYDKTKALVIDPIINFSTYQGGNDDDIGNSVAVDMAGNIYVAGVTYSRDFSATNIPQGNPSNTGDIFVTKLSPTGQRVYTTILGGRGEDVGLSIAVDKTGSVWVGCNTNSSDLSVTRTAVQSALGGGLDGYVAKLSAAGDQILYGSYLGGAKEDTINAIALDANGNCYLTGQTTSLNFPTASPLWPIIAFTHESFLTKLSSTGLLLFSTPLGGGAGGDSVGSSVAVDQAGNAYVAGYTNTPFFPKKGAFQSTFGGTIDAFVMKVATSNNSLVYSTFLGGSGDDAAFDISVDAFGNAYVTGLTASPNYPVKGAIQGSLQGGDDAFVTKLDASGSQLLSSTYLGGSGDDVGFGIAVNDCGELHVVGRTRSPNFPLTDPLAGQTTLKGVNDAFATKFNAAGNGYIYSTYVGGSGDDRAFGLANYRCTSVVLTGFTLSPNFPVQNALQGGLKGGLDAFVTRLDTSVALTLKTVSAANYQAAPLASESIVSTFGIGLAGTIGGVESFPLPTTLEGATITVRDSAGTEHPAQLFYASPYQVNFLMPAQATMGPATITLSKEDGTVIREETLIDRTAPGLFTADSSGKGWAAASIQRVRPDGSVTYEPTARFDSEKGQFIAVPIDFGENDQLFLTLFGTGIRHRAPEAAVVGLVGGKAAEVLYAGSQPDYAGLDQVNLRLPRSLQGSGAASVTLTIGGQSANTVMVYFR